MIMAAHEKGQPILIGTVSVERSEFLSLLFKRYNIRHNVLNANSTKEKLKLAQAGHRKGCDNCYLTWPDEVQISFSAVIPNLWLARS